MESEIDEQAFADLCPEIRAILDAEIAEGGGQIARVSRESPMGNGVVVDLTYSSFCIQKPYPAEPFPLPEGVWFHGRDPQCNGIGDHYYCAKHSHTIMASYW